MIQNSLDRLIGGIVDALRDTVLPAVDDEYARAQLGACIELLNNLGTRIAWDESQLRRVADAAEAALAEAVAQQPLLGPAIDTATDVVIDVAIDPLIDGAPVDGQDGGGDDDDDDAGNAARARRDRALARVAAAIAWCGTNEDADSPAALRLRQFAQWHLDQERALLRTGMYST